MALPAYPFITPFRVLSISLLTGAVLVCVFLLSLSVGSVHTSFPSLVHYLWEALFSGNTAARGMEQTILFSIRLPRAIFAGLVGATLSLAGVVFQAILRNPLADPYILGISGGAAAGAISGILLGALAIPMGVPILAFIGALATLVSVFAIAGVKRDIQSHTLLLAGVIVNAFFGAVIMFLLSISTEKELHGIMFWIMGDLSLAQGADILTVGGALLAGALVIYAQARPLNLIVTGEDTAKYLGVNVEALKRELLVAASVMTGIAVSVSGTIGFVGLIIPHVMRMIFGPDHRILIPASILLGAAFLIAADTLARTVMAPMELPVGVITALCGAPYFIYLLRKTVAKVRT